MIPPPWEILKNEFTENCLNQSLRIERVKISIGKLSMYDELIFKKIYTQRGTFMDLNRYKKHS
jgi:hypothetical protein